MCSLLEEVLPVSEDYAVASILKALFQHLAEANIPYCVLRDYEGLPETFGNDLDILVERHYIGRFREILLNAVMERGWLLVKEIRKFAFWSYYFCPSRFEDSQRHVLQVDVFSPITWKGIALVSSEYILRERRLYKQFYVARPGHEAATTLLKDLLAQGQVLPKHQPRIRTLAERDPDGLSACIETPVGTKTAWLLCQHQKNLQLV